MVERENPYEGITISWRKGFTGNRFYPMPCDYYAFQRSMDGFAGDMEKKYGAKLSWNKTSSSPSPPYEGIQKSLH